MNWFYAVDGKQVGPVSEADFDTLIKAGTVGTETMVWRDGMTDWQPYGQVSGGAAAPVAVGNDVACAECGKIVPQDDAIRFGDAWVCAACKPIFVQKLKEGGTVAGVFEYAGFGIRFAAQFLDGVLLGIVNAIMGVAVGVMGLGASRAGARGGAVLAAQLVVWAVQIALAMGYETFFVGKYGATPGKMACKLRVITPEGEPISFARACGRYWAKQLSTVTLCIGYLMVAFDKEEHRGLHDRICNTRVVKR